MYNLSLTGIELIRVFTSLHSFAENNPNERESYIDLIQVIKSQTRSSRQGGKS